MAKFKVGDKVRVLKSVYLTYVPGHVLEVVAIGVTGRRGDIEAADSHGFGLTFYPHELEHIAPKSKTIPARNLSGKHIGRVVTITTVDGIVLTAELTGVSHTSFAVGAQVKGARSYPKDHRDGLFNLDPESEVVVNA